MTEPTSITQLPTILPNAGHVTVDDLAYAFGCHPGSVKQYLKRRPEIRVARICSKWVVDLESLWEVAAKEKVSD